MRTARLLLDGEAWSEDAMMSALSEPHVRRAALVREVPMRPARAIQRLLLKAGALDYERMVERPALAARQAALGQRASGPPRFLIRVDEFPHYRAWNAKGEFGTGSFERFHGALREAGAPYLVAVLPRVSRDPLDPRCCESRPLEDGEVEMLHALRSDGVAVAMHGLNHRTRFASARRHSELCGLSRVATEALLDRGTAELSARGIHPKVFVAPFNRFDAAQLPLLAERFDVICGGPESVGLLGFHSTPQWRGQAVYLPSYAPYYGTAKQMLVVARSAIERKTGLLVPIVLHWEWEARDGWRSLRQLVETIGAYAMHWEDFLAAAQPSDGTQAS